MPHQSLYKILQKNKKDGKKLFAVLIDPDKCEEGHLAALFHIDLAKNYDWILVGGSFLESGNIENCIEKIRKFSDLPMVIFPGDPDQICNKADAILLLSLLSGRNPDFLIGHQVDAAFTLRNSELELISTAYILIDTGSTTAVTTNTQTTGIPESNSDLILSTALASEQLGFKSIYLEAGSGSIKMISSKIISEVVDLVDIPVIAGGGIKTLEQVHAAWDAGADLVVVGTALETEPSKFFN